MKKVLLGAALTAAFLFAGYVAAKLIKDYIRPVEFMSLKKVCRRWGEQPLDEAKFKASGEDRSLRAKMTCSLLKNQKKYIGADSYKIREILGPPSGYFFSEAYTTYLINRAGEMGKEDVWQILFLIDRDQKISKIVVHKNCCYR